MPDAGTVMIRKARPEEAALLTDLSFDSKRYWDYPETFFQVWRSELTINEEYLGRNEVFVHEAGKTITGYYSLVDRADALRSGNSVIPAGTWLEHMFVRPDCIGCGIGRTLFQHLRVNCRKKRIALLQILADPHARGFYEKMGCSYLGEFPSSITGRSTPWLSLECRAADH